jgi:hypothetical protein
MIEERKHGEQNNEHDNKKCGNTQNNIRGNLYYYGVVTIT